MLTDLNVSWGMGMKRFTASAISPQLVRLSSVLFFMEFVRSAFVVSFLPAYATDSGISVTAVGLAVSAHYMADTLLKTAAGYWVDRLTPRLVLHICFAVAFAGLGTAFFGQQPWLIVVGAILIGIAVSPVWLICLSSIREDARASQMGSIYTVWLLSLGMGPVALNFVLDRGYSFSFWLLAALLGIGWLCTLRGSYQTALSSLRPASLREQIAQLGARLASMKPFVPGMVIQTAAAGLLLPVLPSFATNKMGLDYSDYSFVLIVGGTVTAISLIPMGRLADRWGHRRFLVAGFSGLAVALYMLLSSKGLPSATFVAAVLGLSYSLVLPAWNALLSTFVPKEQKGTGWGVLSSIEGLGVMIGPMLGGWVAGKYDETVTVAVSASLVAAIAVFYMVLPRQRFVPGEADKTLT